MRAAARRSGRPAVARPRPTRRSPRPHGCTQATRLACPPGRATLAPRHRPADPRGVSALPRDEAAAPRLPQLRLVPGPPGRRAQAGRRRRRQPTPTASPVTSGSPDGVRVAVDAMGGDHGPSEVIPGALDFARSHPADEVILVGDDATVRAHRRRAARQRPHRPRRQVIGMDEHPALALREKKDASILVATDLVRRGEADAVVTAGHTGAGMAAAVLRLGRLPGVDRPALAVQMITDAGPMVLLDIGANPDSTAENLAQYARMGAIFAERVLGVAEPAGRPPVDRRGEGQGRRPDPARDRAAGRLRPALRRQHRGQGPDPPPGRRRRHRRGRGQRRHQVLRGPVRLHLRPVAGRVPARPARPRWPTC